MMSFWLSTPKCVSTSSYHYLIFSEQVNDHANNPNATIEYIYNVIYVLTIF